MEFPNLANLVKENKSYMPVLSISIANCRMDVRTLFRESINDNFTQRVLGMIQFIHREVISAFLHCFSFFHSFLADFVGNSCRTKREHAKV